ncbi:hypothetical protein Bca4012_055495 [Brassica carinata]
MVFGEDGVEVGGDVSPCAEPNRSPRVVVGYGARFEVVCSPDASVGSRESGTKVGGGGGEVCGTSLRRVAAAAGGFREERGAAFEDGAVVHAL